jgi:hypothetical protein
MKAKKEGQNSYELPRPIGKHLDQLLTKNGPIGKNAFIALCKKGCDQSILAELFTFLAADTALTRPVDSLERALDPLDKRKLASLQKKLKEVATTLQLLHSTKLVQWMVGKNELDIFHPIFNLPRELHTYADEFLPLILRKTDQIGSKQHPEYNRLLIKIYNYIYDSTGAWHDRLVADIHNAIIEHPPDKPKTTDALKEWRSSQGLVDR